MRFIGIRCKEEQVDICEGDDPYGACPQVGLDRRKTDHGTLPHRLAIIVYEYGVVEPGLQDFFAIGRTLYQGNAIIYSYNSEGETVSVNDDQISFIGNSIQFFQSRGRVERAIRQGIIDRPHAGIWSSGMKEEHVVWEFGDKPRRNPVDELLEVFSTILVEDVATEFRSIAASFSITDEDQRKMVNEISQFVAKWMDTKIARNPKVLDPKYKELAEGPTEQGMTLLSKAIAMAYFGGAKFGLIGMFSVPPNTRHSLRAAMEDAFRAGLKTAQKNAAEFDTSREWKKDEERGGNENGGGDTQATENTKG